MRGEDEEDGLMKEVNMTRKLVIWNDGGNDIVLVCGGIRLLALSKKINFNSQKIFTYIKEIIC